MIDCRVRLFWLSSAPLRYKHNELAPEIAEEIMEMRKEAEENIRRETGHATNDDEVAENIVGGRRLVWIGIGLTLFQQVTGQPTLMYYAVSVFESAGLSGPGQAALATVLLGVFKMAGTALTILKVDAWGRRYFLLLGQLGMLSGLALLIAAFFIKDILKTDGPVVSGLAVIGLTLFFASYSTGYGPTTWVILSELFPVAQRGRAMSLAVACNWGSNLVISLTFLSLVGAIGESLCFVLYFLIGMAALAFCYYLVPETLGARPEDLSALANQGWLVAKRVPLGLLDT